MSDLLIKGGTVVDPAQGLHEILDVVVTNGRIDRLGNSLSPVDASQTIDATGKIVTPGLIDIHTHVYRGDNRRDPDELSGVLAGVTTLADAGGAAPDDLDDFKKVVLPRAETKVYSFLNSFSRQAGPWNELATDGIPAAAAANPDLVKGVKVHVMPLANAIHGLKAVEAAKAAAVKAGIPVMLHVGDIGLRTLPRTMPEFTSQALDILDSGDIVAHLFSALTGSATDDDLNVLPALIAARKRGVWVDSAAGDYQFSWETAEAICSQEFYPDTIATDIEIHSQLGRTEEPLVTDRRVAGVRVVSERSMVEYMANFFKLGFSLDDIIRMATATPAKVLGIEDTAGSLRPGMPADITVLDLVEGSFRLTDATGESRIGTQALVPVVTIKDGVTFAPGPGGHEWGFTPPEATASEVAALT